MAPTPTRASPSNESPQSTNAFAPSPTTPTPAPRPTSSTVAAVSSSTQARLLRSQRPAPYLPPHAAASTTAASTAAASTAAANQARPPNRQLFTPEQPSVANNTSSFHPNTTINTAVNNIAHRPDSNYAAWPPLEVLILFNFVNGLPIMPLEYPMMQELLGPGPLDEQVRVEHELRVVALEQWMGALMAGRTVNDGGQLWRAVRDAFGENEFDRL
ncbi:MAG: hypothetical protein Q9202_004882 [Teloschistes flavicans]